MVAGKAPGKFFLCYICVGQEIDSLSVDFRTRSLKFLGIGLYSVESERLDGVLSLNRANKLLRFFLPEQGGHSLNKSFR